MGAGRRLRQSPRALGAGAGELAASDRDRVECGCAQPGTRHLAPDGVGDPTPNQRRRGRESRARTNHGSGAVRPGRAGGPGDGAVGGEPRQLCVPLRARGRVGPGGSYARDDRHPGQRRGAFDSGGGKQGRGRRLGRDRAVRTRTVRQRQGAGRARLRGTRHGGQAVGARMLGATRRRASCPDACTDPAPRDQDRRDGSRRPCPPRHTRLAAPHAGRVRNAP